MELEYSNDLELLLEMLKQIRTAGTQLQEWNKDVDSVYDLMKSELGMQRLAGNCMLIQVIGEVVNKIEKYTDGKFLVLRPEIPWKKVVGMRNRISHGYFDLDAGYIENILKEDIAPLMEAIDALIKHVETMMIEKEVDDHCTDPVPSRST